MFLRLIILFDRRVDDFVRRVGDYVRYVPTKEDGAD